MNDADRLTITLIDLSCIGHQLWNTTTGPAQRDVHRDIAQRVREIADSSSLAVAVCCDSGGSFRQQLDPNYKANRPERSEPFAHQMKLAVDALALDGFPIWRVEGFEADDIIATATGLALADPRYDVVIVTVDKDLMQLVEPRVTVQSARDGTRYDAAKVVEKYNVLPTQMRDYLTMVGDKADNITGIKGIGTTKAAQLLAQFGSLDAIYAEMKDVGAGAMGLSLAVVTALREFAPLLDTTRTLVTLRKDVPLAFNEVLTPRVQKPRPQALSADTSDDAFVYESTGPVTPVPPEQPNVRVMTVEPPKVLPALPDTWELQLNPRTDSEARKLAINLFNSNMFSAYGNAEAVFSTILLGRELGIPAMTSLRTIHNIKGKHALSAQLVVGLCLKSPLCEYFEMRELSATSCTWVAKRKGRPEQTLTHTIRDG